MESLRGAGRPGCLPGQYPSEGVRLCVMPRRAPCQVFRKIRVASMRASMPPGMRGRSASLFSISDHGFLDAVGCGSSGVTLSPRCSTVVSPPMYQCWRLLRFSSKFSILS
eukprot:2475404-Amphidinium_carterae.1